MRVIVQRVLSAGVHIESKLKAKIAQGFLVYLGVEPRDSMEDVQWLTAKIAGLRVFADDKGAMNLSLKDVSGEVLVISQFTLHAKTKKGNRPSFTGAAEPKLARALYERFLEELSQKLAAPVQSGEFGADMQVESVNDGPVTLMIDSKNRE